jgi:drug/metabolite transporter (DMT)-like permease
MLGEAMALASAAFWAFGSALAKNVTSRMSAFYLSVIRYSFGALLTVVICAAAGQLLLIGETPARVLGILLGCSVVVMFGNVAFIRAIALDDVSRIFPLTNGLYIFLSVVASILFADEPVTWRTGAGGFLVLVGIYFLSTGGRRPTSEQPKKGMSLRVLAILMGTIAAVAWTVSLVGVSDAMKYVEALPANAIRMPFVALMLVGINSATGDFKRQRTTRHDFLVVAVSGLLAGASSLTFVAALKYASPATVAILNSTAPLFLAPTAYLFLKERPTVKVLIGTVICVGGVILTLL